MAKRPTSYAEFWPYYLAEHSTRATLLCHAAGSLLAILILALGLIAGDWRALPAALVAGYGLAWLGHLVFEHNRPATLRYPLWSFASDWRMLALFLCGRLGAERRRRSLE